MIENSDNPRLDLALVLVRFPEKADRIRKLAATTEEFREICEHYSLARIALERFMSQSARHQRPEVVDYKKLIADLEQEIREFIECSPLSNEHPPQV